MPSSHGFGWKPGLPDLRDWVHSFGGAAIGTSDLRNSGHLPSIWDQSRLGSCVPHGTLRALVFDLSKQGDVPTPDAFMPSRLFDYYNGRVLEDTVSEDSGLTITDGVKAINKWGAPAESEWPYEINRFTEKPPEQAYTDATQRIALKYARVPQDASSMAACLAAGTPFVIGFTVYTSFESDAVASNGRVPMPKTSEQVLGGHCMCVVGWDGSNFICANSWGESWGDDGYCYMPAAYLTDSRLSDDFWTIQQVSSPDPAPTPPTPPTSDFEDKAQTIADKFGEVMGGEPTFVRDIHRTTEGPLVEKVWKRGGIEIGVKNLHP
jgi:C1A family cysteine protease